MFDKTRKTKHMGGLFSNIDPSEYAKGHEELAAKLEAKIIADDIFRVLPSVTMTLDEMV